jgi:hypothetical protein
MICWRASDIFSLNFYFWLQSVVQSRSKLLLMWRHPIINTWWMWRLSFTNIFCHWYHNHCRLTGLMINNCTVFWYITSWTSKIYESYNHNVSGFWSNLIESHSSIMLLEKIWFYLKVVPRYITDFFMIILDWQSSNMMKAKFCDILLDYY